MGAAPLELRRHREGEHDIGAGADLDEEIGLLGDAGALRVDDDQPGICPFARRLNLPREMQVGHRDVVAPHHDEVRVAHLLGRHPGRGAVEARVGGAAHDPAELPPREQRCSELVEEPAVHRTPGQLAVRAGVVQRQHRLRAMPRDCARDALMDQVQCLVPGDRRERVATAPTHALQRLGKPPRAVHELGIGTRHLVADHAGRVRIGFRTAHTEDTDPIGLDYKAARIRAIQRADAGPCLDGIGDGHHDPLPCWTAVPPAVVHCCEIAVFEQLAAEGFVRSRTGDGTRVADIEQELLSRPTRSAPNRRSGVRSPNSQANNWDPLPIIGQFDEDGIVQQVSSCIDRGDAMALIGFHLLYILRSDHLNDPGCIGTENLHLPFTGHIPELHGEFRCA